MNCQFVVDRNEVMEGRPSLDIVPEVPSNYWAEQWEEYNRRTYSNQTNFVWNVKS